MKKLASVIIIFLFFLNANAQQPRVYGFEVFSNEFTDYEEVKYLSLTNIGAVPPKIKKFKNLQHVAFYGNDWDYTFYLPAEFYELKNLESITIYNCDLQELSPDIKNLTNLETFIFNGGALKELPAEIGQLENLKTLVLDSRCLPLDLPTTVNLKNLKRLQIPSANLPQMPALQKLNYSNLNKGNIPKSISNMPGLRTLIVDYGCNIFFSYDGSPDTSVRNQPGFYEEEFKRIAQIPKLDTLMLSDLNFERATPYMHLLKNASVIILTNVPEGGLEAVKKALPNTKIEEIFNPYDKMRELLGGFVNFPEQRPELLYYNAQEQLPANAEISESDVLKLFNIKTIPAFVAQMPHLKDLYISTEGEFNADDALFKLTKIEKLSISGANITGFDARLKQLKNLRSLYINNPVSAEIPPAVTELTTLQSLTFISDCKEVNLPAEITKMPSLKTFSTNATTLPALPNIETLSLLSNALKPLEIDISKFKKLENITLEYSVTCDDKNNNFNDDGFWKKEFNTLAKAPQNAEITLIGLNWEMAQSHASKLKNIRSIIIVDPNSEADHEEWSKILPNVKFEN